ncbi:MAG: exopolysaccharide Pel transporter PelG, partial [Gammaproteobacteria bacterium]|nr:exopolysaccharide Pel transporter PelG [Gammaproteobacteria bacterium]
MAGIGFVLRKLTRQDNLFGLVRGFAHSALASNGPWLFTILSLGSVTLLGAQVMALEDLVEFRLIIVYNFGMSLVMSGPVLMVVTRTLADLIFDKDVVRATGVLMAAGLIMLSTQLPVAIGVYVLYADLSAPMRMAAIANFLLVSGLWLVSVYLTALKDYRAITLAFGLGMVVAALAGGLLAEPFGAVGMLFGFNAGVGLIFAMLMAKILAEYPYPPTQLRWV